MNRRALASVVAAAAITLGTLAPVVTATVSAGAQPVPSESAIIELQEGPVSSSPTPQRRAQSSAAPAATVYPTVVVPTIAPVLPRVAPSPRSIAPLQPTVTQALADPNVQSILRRPIGLLANFGWMAGTWRAHNVEQLGDGRQRDLGINTYVFAPTMKGRWIFGADGKASDYFYITYDPFSEHWILVRLNGAPAYGIWISDRGWHGKSIEFTSTFSYADGRPYRRRITIVHKDARTFGIYDEEQLPDGSWTNDDAVELTKQQ